MAVRRGSLLNSHIEESTARQSDVARIHGILTTATVPSDLSYLPFDMSVDASKSLTLMENLKELKRFFSRGPVLDDSLVAATLDFLSRNLCKPLPDIPRHLIWSSNLGPLKGGNALLYLIVHQIMELCIRSLPFQQFERWLADTALRPLVGWLESPDAAERASVESLLRDIFTAFPNLRALAVLAMERRLALVVPGVASFPCVSSYLAQIMSYYESEGQLPSRDWFCSTVLPLFTSPFLPVFHEGLQEFCAFMECYFDDLPLDIIRFLLRHWPCTDSAKVHCFVTSLAKAARLISGDRRLSVERAIIARIAQCVASENTVIVKEALLLICDISFVALFDVESFIAQIYGPVVRQLHNWERDVHQKALEAVTALRSVNGEFAKRAEDGSADQGKDAVRAENWDLLVRNVFADEGRAP
jgi:hypothetical protein